MPMPITQTSRTILFEHFLDDDQRRLDYVVSGRLSNDETAKLIREKYAVRSFREFLEKFPPTYYELVTQVNGMPQIIYTADKPESGTYFVEHMLCNQPFYQAMQKLYEDKGRSGKNDFDFPYEEATKVLGPEYAMEEAKRLRGRLSYQYHEYCALQERNASEYELADAAEEINQLLERVSDTYSGNNMVNLFPLAIEDTRSKIALLEKASEGVDGVVTDVASALPGRMDFDKDGAVIFLPAPAEPDTQSQSASFIPALPELLRQALPAPEGDDGAIFRQNLTLSVLSNEPDTSSGGLMTLDRFELENKLQTYVDFYAAAQESFGKSVVRLIEKTLDVKAFFDHAAPDTELIIANCAISDFLKQDTVEKFKRLITQMGQEAGDEKIWFAIIPSVSRKEFQEAPLKSAGLGIRRDGAESKPKTDAKAVFFEETKRALEILSDAEIITFFNYTPNVKTCGEGLTADLVKAYKKAAGEISEQNRKYAVLAYPNFTILPRRETKIEITPERSIQVNALYLDAAYVACGLVCASQSMDFLKAKGFPVLMQGANNIQPVRFHFENDFDTKWGEKAPLAQVFHTKLNRGGILSWEKTLREEIEKNGGFGFCFCGDEKLYTYRREHLTQRNLYVYRARTLAEELPADGGNSRYRPLFMTLENCYIRLLHKLEGEAIQNVISRCNRKDNMMYINNLFYSPDYSNVRKKDEGVLDKEKNQLRIAYDQSEGEPELEIVEL